MNDAQAKYLATLTPEVRAQVELSLQDDNHTKALYGEVYRETPVPLDEFIFGDKYLALPKGSVFPALMDLMWEIDKPDIREAFICAGKGSGKCFAPSTLVWTDHALSPIGAIVPQPGEHHDVRRVLTECGEALATHAVRYNDVATVRLETHLGYVHEGTPDALLWVMDSAGREGWRKFADIDTSCYVKVHLDDVDMFSDRDPLTDEEAEMLGFIVGDGSTTDVKKNRLLICAGSRQHADWVRSYLMHRSIVFKERSDERAAGEYRQFSVSRHKHGGWHQHRIKIQPNVEILDWLFVKCDVVPGPHTTCKTPSIIKRSSKRVIAAYLRGLFEADGWVCDRALELGMASELLVRETQELLRHLGVPSRFFTKFNEEYQRDYFYVAVRFEHGRKRFMERVGVRFQFTERHKKVNSRKDRDYLPHQRRHLVRLEQDLRPTALRSHRRFLRLDTYLRNNVNLTRARARACARTVIDLGLVGYEDFIIAAHADAVWDQVESVTPSRGDVCDFCVPHTSSVLGNGAKHHNSSVVSIVMARATYRLMCYRDPAAYFNLLPKDLIAIVNMSISSEQAELVMFSKYWNLIMGSACFHADGKPLFEKRKRHIEFPGNLHALSGHSGYRAYFGYNVFCAVLDEFAWFRDTQDHPVSAEIYQGVKSSAKTRFESEYKLIAISTPQAEDDAIMTKIDEIRELGTPVVLGETVMHAEIDGDSHAKVL